MEMTPTTRPVTGNELSPKFVPNRQQVLKEKFPQFDILIDDNPKTIKGCSEEFPDKDFILCDYKCNRNKDTEKNNVYMISVTISNLKDGDFKNAFLKFTKNNIMVVLIGGGTCSGKGNL